MPKVGLEPTRLSAMRFERIPSTNSSIRANIIGAVGFEPTLFTESVLAPPRHSAKRYQRLLPTTPRLRTKLMGVVGFEPTLFAESVLEADAYANFAIPPYLIEVHKAQVTFYISQNNFQYY